MPKVSVCISTYNRAHYLPVAVESVLNQTEPDFEILICDDGSTDATPTIVSQWQDPRIRYIRHLHNIGKSNNMRSGFEAATGDYFIKFDDDDRLTPDFLARTSQILDQHPEIDFVGTDHWIIDSQNQRDETATQLNSQKWGRSKLSAGLVDNLLAVVFVDQSFQVGATLFRRAALQTVGFMRADWQNCEDTDLFVRLALAGKQGYYLPELLMEYRVHQEQQGLDRAIPYLKDKLTYLESHQFEVASLEQIRRTRLSETQLLLGLRLIEKGETAVGRQLVNAAILTAGNSTRARVGLFLSHLPVAWRPRLFSALRKLRP